jgi:hypothetical protein
MHHPALVQQKLSDDPANKQHTAGKPKHSL